MDLPSMDPSSILPRDVRDISRLQETVGKIDNFGDSSSNSICTGGSTPIYFPIDHQVSFQKERYLGFLNNILVAGSVNPWIFSLGNPRG
jgi:hypothetical protein